MSSWITRLATISCECVVVYLRYGETRVTNLELQDLLLVLSWHGDIGKQGVILKVEFLQLQVKESRGEEF